MALFSYAYLRWKSGSNVIWAALAAIAAGYGMGTRYLTVFAFITPFLAYEGYLIFRARKWTTSHVVFSTIFLIFIGLNLYFNLLVTGNLFDPPNHYHHSWERLGFQSDYGPKEALVYLISRFFYLLDWVPPILIVSYFFGISSFRKGPAVHQLFAYSFLCIVLAYVFYYSWGGNQFGPRYFVEGFPFLTLAVGAKLEQVWCRRNIQLRKFLIGVVLAALAGNGYLIAKHGVFYETVSAQRKSLYELAEKTVRKPAVVHIKGFLGDKLVMSQEDAVRNHPDLNTPIIYAHDLGDENVKLQSSYPDRTFYRGYYDRTEKQPRIVPLASQ